jgi:hypothetical protein
MDKNQAFNRLLADLQEDSFHGEFIEEYEHLPKLAKSHDMEQLRGRLRKRYQRTRLSATTMYMPRIALTFAIMMTCAVAFLYIHRLNQLKREQEILRQKNTPAQIDSLMRLRGKN